MCLSSLLRAFTHRILPHLSWGNVFHTEITLPSHGVIVCLEKLLLALASGFKREALSLKMRQGSFVFETLGKKSSHCLQWALVSHVPWPVSFRAIH